MLLLHGHGFRDDQRARDAVAWLRRGRAGVWHLAGLRRWRFWRGAGGVRVRVSVTVIVHEPVRVRARKQQRVLNKRRLET